jgi:glycosyltransferase involved in cell wall biosynthesis
MNNGRSKPRLVNLLHDFALGGVTRYLGIFDTEILRSAVEPSLLGIDPKAVIAPRLDADIIVTNFPPSWGRLPFLASLRIRNPKARLIHLEHSYTRAWETLKVPSKARFRAMLKIAMRLFDDIVCDSENQAEWLAEAASIDARRIKVIYPYVENEGLADLPLPDFSSSRRLRIGAFGRFHEQKGFDQLIEAYRAGAFQGAELLIGGFGHDEAALHALAADAPGVSFYGKVVDVADFLSRCDVVAIPSRWEAGGLVNIEAREAGRPILVSPVDGLPEQVGEAGRVVDFASASAVAQAVASLDPPTLAAMAKAARESTRDCGLIRQREWAQFLAGAGVGS